MMYEIVSSDWLSVTSRRTMIRSLRLSVVGAVVFFLSADRGQAGLLTLDQSFDASGNFAIFVFDESVVAQTFTVGRSGLLSQVDLQLWKNRAAEDPILTILGTTAGIPDSSNVLGSVSIPNSIIVDSVDFSSGDFLNVDVSGLGIMVTPGDVLALEVSSPDTHFGSFRWLDSFSSPGYAGGSEFDRFSTDPTTWFDQDPFDAGFQTWVEQTTAVPEPSSLVLLGIGCCGLVGFGRKRKRRLAV